MNVYLAGSFAAQERLRRIAFHLEEVLNWNIVSSWLWSTELDDAEASQRLEYARRDLRDLMSADVFIVDTITPSTSGGSHVELGVALAMPGLKLGRVGPSVSIFHHGLDRAAWANWADLEQELLAIMTTGGAGAVLDRFTP